LTGTERGQFQTAEGLFTFRMLPARGALRPAPFSPTATADRPDTDSRDASLVLVARTSPKVLAARAEQLLSRLFMLYVVVLILVVVLAWYLAYSGALRRNHEQQLAASEARLRLLSSQLISAQEDERRSLSRDLHDELGQLVTAVSLDLQR